MNVSQETFPGMCGACAVWGADAERRLHCLHFARNCRCIGHSALPHRVLIDAGTSNQNFKEDIRQLALWTLAPLPFILYGVIVACASSEAAPASRAWDAYSSLETARRPRQQQSGAAVHGRGHNHYRANRAAIYSLCLSLLQALRKWASHGHHMRRWLCHYPGYQQKATLLRYWGGWCHAEGSLASTSECYL